MRGVLVQKHPYAWYFCAVAVSPSSARRTQRKELKKQLPKRRAISAFDSRNQLYTRQKTKIPYKNYFKFQVKGNTNQLPMLSHWPLAPISECGSKFLLNVFLWCHILISLEKT